VAQAHSYLATVQQRLAAQGFVAQAEVLAGDPVEGILAAAHHTDLISLCLHGSTGLRHRVLGSVGQAVVQHTTVPTLVVRATAQPGHADAGPFRTILVPLDGTSLADQAAAYLASTPLGYGGRFILLRALPAVAPVALPLLIGRTAVEIHDQASQEAVRSYAAADAYLTSVGYTSFSPRSWRTIVTTGDPAREILAAAQREAVDLIVLATHGRRGVDRLLHGSVAHAVLRHAQVPVLLLPDLAVPEPERALVATPPSTVSA
jgi:nucleotide-binding universal stress UspA family protein